MFCWLHHASLHFYSHIPCGMWPLPLYSSTMYFKFLLTHPVWDVTVRQLAEGEATYSISTHTSRVGCDEDRTQEEGADIDFYSHIPCGMWPKDGFEHGCYNNFYSHIPCGMWPGNLNTSSSEFNFYSHIPCGMWQNTGWKIKCDKYFYSHIPCGMWLSARQLM